MEVKTEPSDISFNAIFVALLAALARLAVVLGIAAWLVVLLINEIAVALVYVIATTLALFFSSCPASP